MTNLTKLLAKLKKLEAQATPEINLHILAEAVVPEGQDHGHNLIAAEARLSDFIAATRNALPTLIAELERLLDESAKQASVLEEAGDVVKGILTEFAPEHLDKVSRSTIGTDARAFLEKWGLK
jgi:hypothetical protein